MTVNRNISEHDEERPLLADSNDVLEAERKVALPKLQLAVLLIAYSTQPVAANFIYPFIARLVAELDLVRGDASKIGYYSGLLDALPLISEGLVIMHWTKIGDLYGRKRVLLCGAVGVAFSLTCFGLSKTLPMLVSSRILQGALNANSGTIKTMFGEITEGDENAMAQAFSLIPIVWASGSTLAPLMGGALEHPTEKFPMVFTSRLWKAYPYLLPCIAAASVPTVAFFTILAFLKDTSSTATKTQKNYEAVESGNRTSIASSLGASTDSRSQSPSSLSPPRFRVTRTLVLTLLNYLILVLLGTSFYALIAIFLAAPISLGGAGFNPATIGLCMSLMGVFHGTFQALGFAKVCAWAGDARVLFRVSMMAFGPLYLWMPTLGWMKRSGWGEDSGLGEWVIDGMMFVEAVLYTLSFMGYCCMYILVTRASPNRESLGKTNGLSQIVYSFGGALGPVLVTTLFAITKQYDLLGGNLVYVFLVSLSGLGVVTSGFLPTKEGANGDRK